MKAYELIERGWCQRAYGYFKDGSVAHGETIDSSASCFCLLGALRAAYSSDHVGLNAAYKRCIAILDERVEVFGGTYMSLLDWNDHPSRTKEEVVRLLKEADV